MATFNSRYLSYKQVSEQFIETQNFVRLAKPCHSILMGARGSGKTTMLKMLQPEAIKQYKSKRPDFDLPFYGVYIPSDRQWSFVLEQFADAENPFLKRISRALVNLNVLLAFLETLNVVLKDKNADESCNYRFCKSIISYWKLEETTPPLIDFIRLELRSMAMELQNAVSGGDFEYKMQYVCSSNFVDCLSQAIDIVDIHYADYEMKSQWALCFDEMEIAPEWLKEEIVELDLRSRNQRLLFKLTATPDWEIPQRNFRDATVGNDVDIIKCWNTDIDNVKDWRSFCDCVIESHILEKYHIDRKQLNELITIKNPERTFFLENLPKVDRGFAEYYKRDYTLDENNQASISRSSVRSKYYNTLVLAMRYFCFSKENKKVAGMNNTYLGDWLLYNMADGNPRALLNILNEIPSRMEVNGKLKMNIPSLGKVVREYSKVAVEGRFSFCAMKEVRIGDDILTFRNLLDIIGGFFNNELLGDNYCPMPRTMFTIDGYGCLRDFISVGLESGAIIKVDDKTLYSGRYKLGVYRLSYLLYPYYGYVSTGVKDVVEMDEIFNAGNYEVR